jgi:predicted ATPase/DNA-binding CsgD family transcriptional regulator
MERQMTADRPPSEPIPLHDRPNADRKETSSFPSSLTSLIGRENEVGAASAMLRREDLRLLTFTGPGGVGKTQLALAVARQNDDYFRDGVVFVSLAPLRDPALVIPAIASELNVIDSGARPLIDGLRVALRNREMLLFLDNFEHLIAAAPLVVKLLIACSRLKVIVTSRELLSISGEHAFFVPSLGLPEPSRTLSVEELTRSDAVRLFVTRAREVKPAFALTETNAEAVAGICERLDGLPLAIELAAARIRVLAPPTLLSQMTTCLPLLTGGHRDAPERLQTMRQAIAWSYDLLPKDEQTLFRGLSVFVGGFTLDAAIAVMPMNSVLDGLTSLLDKNLLIQAEQADGETRFSMLETIREYGLEQLQLNGETAELRARHAAYYLDLAEQADRVPILSTRATVSQRLETELPNLRAALTWADEQHDAELLLRMAVAVWWLWDSRDLRNEAGAWLERAMEATNTGVPSALRGQRAHLLAIAGYVEIWRGATERAETLLGEGSTLARETGDARAMAMVALSQGVLAIWQSDWDRADTHLTDALARWRDQGDEDLTVSTLYLLGFLAALQGEQKDAESRFAEGLAMARVGGWPVLISFGLEALGYNAFEQGEHRCAATLLADALAGARDGNDPGTIACCVKSLGAVAAITGNAEQATRLFGAAEAMRERFGYAEQPAAELLRLEQAVAPARDRISADAFAAAWSSGREMPFDEAIAEALEVARKVTLEQPSTPEAPAGLTPREVEVLCLLVEGLSDKEIAEELGMSRRTASKHVETILGKLNVPSRTAAATYANRHGLI